MQPSSTRFEAALRNGQKTEIRRLSEDIQAAIMQWQHLDSQIADSIHQAYFYLFYVFSAFIAVMALFLWLLYRTSERSIVREKQSAAYSRAVVLAQERERSCIVQELHDSVAQDLRAVSLLIAQLGRSAGESQLFVENPPSPSENGLSTKSPLPVRSVIAEALTVQDGMIHQIRVICRAPLPLSSRKTPPSFGPEHLGIRGMYERIAMLEGALSFESEPGDTMCGLRCR